MASRTDGALGSVYLLGLAGQQPDNWPMQIAAEFRRYKAEDPLCCPSATSNVTYHLDLVNGKPLIKPVQAGTSPNSGG